VSTPDTHDDVPTDVVPLSLDPAMPRDALDLWSEWA
jgi:hypothetical protein